MTPAQPQSAEEKQMYEPPMFDVTVEKDNMLNEIKRLRRVISWCRPRLSKEAYRATLDKLLASYEEPNLTPIVQS